MDDDDYSYTKTKAIWLLSIWQSWCFGQFYHSRIEVLHNCSAFLCQFLWWEDIWTNWEDFFSKKFKKLFQVIYWILIKFFSVLWTTALWVWRAKGLLGFSSSTLKLHLATKTWLIKWKTHMPAGKIYLIEMRLHHALNPRPNYPTYT